jgi:2-C-methyl-D-erythritol 2,4-cyclodiphosphate synthase
MLAEGGWSVRHVDATVLVEEPHLAPFKEPMRTCLAGAMGLAVEHVSIKATRGEGMGFVGAREGAAALAVATVERQ